MSSPILNIEGPSFGAGVGISTNYVYIPDVVDLRGANSIEALTTVGLTLKTLIIVIINGQSQFWQLTTGAADVADTENQVAPLDFNSVTNNVFWQNTGSFKSGAIGVSVTRSASQGIPTGIDTAIIFNTARVNTGEWSDSSPTRFTCVTPGFYLFNGRVTFSYNTSGQRSLFLRKNSSNYIANNTRAASANSTTDTEVNAAVYLLTGDYIELVANQTVGVNLDVLKVADYTPEFSAVWLGNPVAIAMQPPSIGTAGNSDAPTSVIQPFNTTDVGWYRMFVGGVPAVGGFNLRRENQGGGSALDCDVQFGGFGAAQDGVIQVPKNVMTSEAPGFDGVRVSYEDTTAFVDIHITLSGSWEWTHPVRDGYVPAPYLAPDPGADGSAVLSVAPNVIASSAGIDVPMVSSSGVQIATKGVTGWAAPTGTLSRSSFDPATVSALSVAQHLAALITDELAFGSIQIGIPSSMLYTDMLSLANGLVIEGSVANVTDAFQITVAPDTTVQGIYPHVGTAGGKNSYRLQGYEWGTGSQRIVKYNSGTNQWEIYNKTGILYHSTAPSSPAQPWSVTQWTDATPANVTVTTVAPNTAFTYNVLTDTHTGCYGVNSADSTWTGVYRYVDTFNGKRRYYLYGSDGVDNKRISWNGSLWQVRNDSGVQFTSPEAVTYPDQVSTWISSGSGGPVFSIARMDAVDMAAGIVISGGGSDTDGVYRPQFVYSYGNVVYGRIDNLRYINQGFDRTWSITDTAGGFSTIYASSTTSSRYPWEASYISYSIIAQEKKVAGQTNWHL